MKQIPLKKETLKVNGVDTEFSTLALIGNCLDQIPATGLKMNDFKQRKRINDAIDLQQSNGHADILQLEDYDFEVLKKCVAEVGWVVRNNFVYDFLLQFE